MKPRVTQESLALENKAKRRRSGSGLPSSSVSTTGFQGPPCTIGAGGTWGVSSTQAERWLLLPQGLCTGPSSCPALFHQTPAWGPPLPAGLCSDCVPREAFPGHPGSGPSPTLPSTSPSCTVSALPSVRACRSTPTPTHTPHTGTQLIFCWRVCLCLLLHRSGAGWGK